MNLGERLAAVRIMNGKRPRSEEDQRMICMSTRTQADGYARCTVYPVAGKEIKRGKGREGKV